MDADRRDWTNASGYVVPTETEAIRNMTSEEKATQTARRLFGIFVRCCNLCGFRLNKIELTRDEWRKINQHFVGVVKTPVAVVRGQGRSSLLTDGQQYQQRCLQKRISLHLIGL